MIHAFRNAALALALLALLAAAQLARAQCLQPAQPFDLPGPPLLRGASSFVPLVSFDAGGGEELYAGGRDPQFRAAVVRWNGSAWDTVFASSFYVEATKLTSTSLAGAPLLLATFEAVSGVQLWSFDGTTWSFLSALSARPGALGVFDDGTCEAITVAVENLVLRWNGASLVSLGGSTSMDITALATFDDGTGPRLHVGGIFPSGLATSACLRWNGTAWTPLGTFGPHYLTSLRAYDDGSGPALYAGLAQSPLAVSQGLSALRRWNGTSWVGVGAIAGSVHALDVVDFGGGPRLAFAGESPLSVAPLLVGIGFFDGTNLTSTPGGFDNVPSIWTGSLAFVDGGATPTLYARGNFTTAGGNACTGTASWDGTQWSVPSGLTQAANVYTAGARAFGTWNDGVSEKLVAGGEFICSSGTSACGNTATWDGVNWTMHGSAGGKPGYWINALCSATLAGSTYLYAGLDGINGQTQLQRFDGTAWSPVPGSPLPLGTGRDVNALTVFDLGAGPRLIAGISGAPFSAASAVQFDGNTWNAVGTGLSGAVHDFAIYDEGAGPRLFACGFNLHGPGGQTASVQRWDGVAWTRVGDIGNEVRALCVFDDGTGAQLYVGGYVAISSLGQSVWSVARWNGTRWSALPNSATTFEGPANTLVVHDDGRGDALYVGGQFASQGGVPATNLARFDGVSWETVHGGTNENVITLQSFDDDNDGDRELFVGGWFTQAFGESAPGIARLEGCPSYASFCAGDGSLADHTTPCPCGNTGAAGHGCSNSSVAAGALLAASGSPALDTLVLHVTDTPQSAFGIYLQHDATGDQTFHDGVLCASGNLIRLRRRASVGGESLFPDSTDTTTVSQRGSVTPGSGATRYYSVFYRNASTTFCPPATANVSNGIRVIW